MSNRGISSWLRQTTTLLCHLGHCHSNHPLDFLLLLVFAVQILSPILFSSCQHLQMACLLGQIPFRPRRHPGRVLLNVTQKRRKTDHGMVYPTFVTLVFAIREGFFGGMMRLPLLDAPPLEDLRYALARSAQDTLSEEHEWKGISKCISNGEALAMDTLHNLQFRLVRVHSSTTPTHYARHRHEIDSQLTNLCPDALAFLRPP